MNHLRNVNHMNGSASSRTTAASRFMGSAPRITRGSTVLALIPHYRCEKWLFDCLSSLVEQTRPLDGIVVIDDCSEPPPVEIVQEFPQVTLVVSAQNVGPYRLIQRVIEITDYDAYMFQDADDWSMPERLEALLAEAERTGAELIGTQEIRVYCDLANVSPHGFPLDANTALREHPTSLPLMHPGSLVGRDLVMRLGGFATGLRYSGDAEFLRRAGHASRVVNVPGHYYVRRRRAESLTTSPDTGNQSPARRELWSKLHARAQANMVQAGRGQAPDLAPFAVADPVPLKHLTGPALEPAPASQAAEWLS